MQVKETEREKKKSSSMFAQQLPPAVSDLVII